METLRIEYTKLKFMKYLGHLELMKLFERTFRLEKLPLKYSEGFNPLPKMTFASPLSVGYSSEAEVMEVQLTEQVPIERVLAMRLPEGLSFKRAKYVTCKQSLMSGMGYARYEISSPLESPISEASLSKFLSEEAIFYDKKTKKGTMKQVNILEQIQSAAFVPSDNLSEVKILATLVSGNLGSLNPEMFFNTFRKYVGLETTEDISVKRIGLFSENLESVFDLAD